MRTRATIPSSGSVRPISPRSSASEEENFAKTIDGGMTGSTTSMLADHKAKGETVFSGADAFKLYDTYGFPIDLTMEMAGRRGHDRGSGGLPGADGGATHPRP